VTFPHLGRLFTNKNDRLEFAFDQLLREFFELGREHVIHEVRRRRPSSRQQSRAWPPHSQSSARSRQRGVLTAWRAHEAEPAAAQMPPRDPHAPLEEAPVARLVRGLQQVHVHNPPEIRDPASR
jgi:hypothetical protein